MKIRLFTMIAILFALAACGGDQKAAQANVDMGNSSINKMNDISVNQLSQHGILLKLPEMSKSVVQSMDEDELRQVEALLKEYLHQGQIAEYASTQKNVTFKGQGDLLSLTGNASEILTAVQQRLGDEPAQSPPQ